MCWLATQKFTTTTAPTQARKFAVEHLLAGVSDAAAAADAVDDTAVVVTELVTNAVNAGSPEVTVAVELHRSHVYLTVRDEAPGDPELRDPSPDDPHGRGLKIVDALARSWGSERTDGSKRVWAVLPIPELATVDMDCVVASLV